MLPVLRLNVKNKKKTPTWQNIQAIDLGVGRVVRGFFFFLIFEA